MQVIQQLQEGQPLILTPLWNGSEFNRIAVFRIIQIDRKTCPTATKCIGEPVVGGRRDSATITYLSAAQHIRLEQHICIARSHTIGIRWNIKLLPACKLPNARFLASLPAGHKLIKQERMVFNMHATRGGKDQRFSHKMEFAPEFLLCL